MSESQPVSFEEQKDSLKQLFTGSAVNPGILMGELATAHLLGENEAKDDNTELGVTRFANDMIELYSFAQTLDETGRVDPPLTYEQRSLIVEKKDILSSITDANAGDGPTDTNSLDTTDRK